ncbi:ubiquitin fusion-degradation protein [Encephalitozoon hellem]|uniref:Ubiquitin fusion degradation protein 1 n=1 Tax=Encephalitozoon hellem TaxID=27973 RepID=A0A9Q9F8Y8_ENCHE|nr:ubiquitin fusion-degradation protein [Encephalitozoon hellem ATCC 50504]AFM99212.1 ubiquitin fusion-degradation protein [Encephalitozoon hellem ATCC 50504]KAG5860283.1 ubiquitin fusion-degradation protein [Encephalitozoon hellem]UTX44199.1 ubiquitin fusion degradation protein 1 [Encephalitozoon hellem]|eukprot:XP_003888193.1 ubiquitin fusion-degradation protein [Encephalitozoon hellem ATCC 50504]
MLFDLFGFFGEKPSWSLSPIKFEAGNQNNFGGKVIVPQSVLVDLVSFQIQPPFTFEISHSDGVYKTHCGVLEFTGEEGQIVVPSWMYQQLSMEDADRIVLRYMTFPLGRFVKLIPHSVDFLEIENPKLELESCLRNYQVLSEGDEILCQFDEVGSIRFTVAHIEPLSNAVYIVDTDLAVDFLEPIGFKDKMERERTVAKYVEVIDSPHDIKPIKMKKLGLYMYRPAN